jgi:hypothetical protein
MAGEQHKNSGAQTGSQAFPATGSHYEHFRARMPAEKFVTQKVKPLKASF